MRTRREALAWLGLGAVGALAGCGGRARPASIDTMRRDDSDDDALDHALREIHRREPFARGGLSSHASMVAETLCVLGHAEQAVARVERDRSDVLELPRPRDRIDASNWRAALGRTPDTSSWERNVARWGDWVVFFEAELAEDPWRSVLERWAPRLLPGVAAAATHGAIRTAHAVRALERKSSADRIAELARGLAYWAASFQELPSAPEQRPIATTYLDALEAVPRWADTHDDPPAGNIVAGFDAAASVPGFERAIGLIASDDPTRGFADLVATSAQLYLRHGTRHHAIAFVHAVTGPTALRRLLPSLPPALAPEALARAWQLVAAIHTAYARSDDPDVDIDEGDQRSHDELVARAIDAGDDHAIKLTEALLWSHATRTDPVLLAAAERAVH